MSVRPDSSVSGRLHAAKVACASLAAIATVTLVTFTARAWWRTTSPAANQAGAASQPTPAANAAGYVRSARLWPSLREALGALGDRLEKPGKERLTLLGTISRSSTSPTETFPIRLILEIPDRMRLEEQVGPQVRITIFDGQKVVKAGGLPIQSDEDLVETLVFDSADHFFFGQMQGLGTRFLGPRFRPYGAAANYSGPFYDLYQVTDRITVGPVAREQHKLYKFNSDTLLLEQVRYELKRNGVPLNVEVRLTGWQKVQGQQVLGSITRRENGAPTLTLAIISASVGPRVADGIFTNP